MNIFLLQNVRFAEVSFTPMWDLCYNLSRELEIEKDVFIMITDDVESGADGTAHRTNFLIHKHTEVGKPIIPFVTKIRNLAKEKFIKVLLHEFRHFYQYANGSHKINSVDEHKKPWHLREFEIDANNFAAENLDRYMRQYEYFEGCSK